MSLWERLAVSTPLNKTAATVVSQSRAQYQPATTVPDYVQHWDVMPPLKDASGLKAQSSWDDLTGRMVGRMTVMGYYGRSQAGETALWVVRCPCGDFEVRKTKTIKKNANQDHCCHYCEHTNKIKLGFVK